MLKHINLDCSTVLFFKFQIASKWVKQKLMLDSCEFNTPLVLPVKSQVPCLEGH